MTKNVEESQALASKMISNSNGTYACIAVGLIYFCFLFGWLYVKEPFSIHTDEGYNLIKTKFVSDGLSLYTDIWSDQPPVFTYLLLCWQKCFGTTVNAARMLTVLLASATLMLVCQFAFKRAGWLGMICSGFALVTAPGFFRYSCGVMLDVPATAFTLISFRLLEAGIRNQRLFIIVASAIVFGIACETKAYPLALVPACLCVLFFSSPGVGIWRQIKWPLTWLIGFIGTVALIITTTGQPFAITGLMHISTATTAMLMRFDQSNLIMPVLPLELGSILLIAFGVAYIWQLGSNGDWLFLAWFLIIVSLHFVHRPFWLYYFVQIAVPGSILAGVALAWSRDGFDKGLFKPNSLARLQIAIWLTCGLFLADTLVKVYRFDRSASNLTSSVEWRILHSIRENSDQGAHMLTDSPMFAYRGGYDIAPEAAVLSPKRTLVQPLTESEIQGILSRRPPEVIVLVEHESLGPEVDRYLKDNCRIIAAEGLFQVWIRVP